MATDSVALKVLVTRAPLGHERKSRDSCVGSARPVLTLTITTSSVISASKFISSQMTSMPTMMVRNGSCVSNAQNGTTQSVRSRQVIQIL